MTTIILGGGTFSDVSPHLSLCTRAFGTTAKQLKQYCDHASVPAQLKLTKMADSESNLVTNQDVENYVEGLMFTTDVKAIIFNAAMCDFSGYIDRQSPDVRLISSEYYEMSLVPNTRKVIQLIKKRRPDIFLVGFKTTAGALYNHQLHKAREQMTTAGCDLVLANDITARNNILVYSQNMCSASNDREELLQAIVHEIKTKCYQ
jgi:phosphopantothenoylcysteine synthetase/decarboxylase